jgi:hypothetical protein
MSAEVCNGVDGQDGQDAPPTPFSPVGVIDPCGPQGPYDEVLLQLSNGLILASFSENQDGLNTRLVLLPDGIYKSTDGTSCIFKVDSGNVTW